MRAVLLLWLIGLACTSPVEANSPALKATPHHAKCASGMRLAVSPSAITVVVAGTGTLADTVTTDCRQTVVDTGTVTWASRDTTIATVAGADRSATVTGVGAGTTFIVATYHSLTDSASITVTAADTVACTPSSTHMCPGDDLNAKVQAAATGTSFTFGAGTYYTQSIVPKASQTFTGGTGVILDGGRVLTGWTHSGSTWYVDGQTQAVLMGTAGGCESGFPKCQQANQLWMNDTLKTPQAALAYVGAGDWFFDDANNRIYVGDDPTGKTVETSVTERAFKSSSSGVTLTGLTVRHYAAKGNSNGVIVVNGNGWTVQHDTIVDNAGSGIEIEGSISSGTFADNVLSRNGQYGLSISGSGGRVAHVQVLRSRLDSNNTAGWSRGFGAGAGKFTNTDSLVFTGNRAEYNYGNGPWGDINNRWMLFTSDTAQNNAGTGFFYEISYGCTFTNLVSVNNGTNPKDAFQNGAGILISASSNCEVSNSTVSGNKHGILLLQQNRGSGTYGAHLVSGANIHDNTITMSAGTTGFKGDYDVTAFNTTRNNCFTDNDYTLPAGTTKFFSFNGSTVADATWQAAGCNSGETITR